jgi:hypothetical protein
MTLRLEIVGDSERAQRMIHQLLALKVFEVRSVPEPDRPARVGAPSGQRSATIALEGTRNGFAVLQADAATGAIEALPVVRLGFGAPPAAPGS